VTIHGAADGGDGLQIRMIAVNVLNKQSRIDDKGWSSNLDVILLFMVLTLKFLMFRPKLLIRTLFISLLHDSKDFKQC